MAVGMGDGMKNRTVVFGMARSGIAAARLLLSKGRDVVCADESEKVSVPPDLSGAAMVSGKFNPGLLDGAVEVVISPGVPMEHPLMAEAASRGIPVISELELAFRHAAAPVIAVTGTNGKSTTVSMIGEILKAAGKEAIVAGNVGVPFSGVAESLGPDGFFVIEVSSFQLEAIREFHPASAGILNLTPDHLDRYRSLDDYYRLKERIVENCGGEDLYFYNADDAGCASVAARFPGRLAPFSSTREVEGGAWLDGDDLVRTGPGGARERIIGRRGMGVVGIHNAENALAAVSSLQGLGIPAAACREALAGFRGLEHRMERVAEISGVTYYNDSKATNVEAAVKSLSGLGAPVVLIAGGYDKGSDYTKFVEVLPGIKAVVTIGKAAPLIEKALEGRVRLERADSMMDAVVKSSRIAGPGDMVVLSPACASFDMFRNFEHRGEVFRECVLETGGMLG